MPSRIIRESSLTSRTLEGLSGDAERLFFRLTIIADDAGRFDADPRVLLAKCFPLKVGLWQPADVMVWRDELAQSGAICLYSNGATDRCYGYFPSWDKHQRSYGLKSSFPKPTGESRKVPHGAGKSRSYLDDDSDLDLDKDKELFTRFWEGYPRKIGKGAAEKAWRKIKPRPTAQLVDRMLATITAALQTEQWKKEGGAFIPHPSTWLNQKRWEDEFMKPPGSGGSRFDGVVEK